MLDYFNTVHEKQPYRSSFIGILSNYSSSWVYIATFDEKGPKIEEYPCSSLADAIIFANTLSASQLRATIPSLDTALDPKFSVLALGKHYFLLSVKKRVTVLDNTVPRSMPTRQTVKITPRWFPPVQHRKQKNQFVLKIAHDSQSLDNEIKVLEKLCDANCLHIPELVWTRGSGDSELGILPIGEPVLPGEPAAVSRKIVRGMIDGLRYLHSRGIIHRDIRLSNLILKRGQNDVNVVIIDYETAFDSEQNRSTGNLNDSEVNYSGGYLCWPRRLLQSREQSYIPEPADDLFACILVVLHLLFPRRFDDINAGNIRAGGNQPETLRVLQMWRDIESSKIWGQFYEAARDENYDGLLEISEVFSHV
jgi:protein kinase-like protein